MSKSFVWFGYGSCRGKIECFEGWPFYRTDCIAANFANDTLVRSAIVDCRRAQVGSTAAENLKAVNLSVAAWFSSFPRCAYFIVDFIGGNYVAASFINFYCVEIFCTLQ